MTVSAGELECEGGSLRELLNGELEDGVPYSRAYMEWERPKTRAPGMFVALGTLVFAGGLGTVLVLVVSAATSGGGVRTRVAPMIAAIGCGVLAGLSLAFVVAAPSQLETLRAGSGLLLALAGATVGLAGSLALLRQDATPEPTSEHLAAANRAATMTRWPGLIAGAVGVALVLAAVLTDTWFKGREGDFTLKVGLQQVEACERGEPECIEQTIPARVEGARHPRRMKIFIALGTLASWTGSAAAIAFAAIALLVLLRQPVRRPISFAHVLYAASAAFTACAIGYTFMWPDEISAIHVSLGPFLAIGGAACLAASGVLLGRWVDAAIAAAPPLPPSEETAPLPVPVPVIAPILAPTVAPSAIEPSPFAPPGGSAAIASVAQFLPFVPPPPPPLAIPPCPSCATPMLWVSARSSYVCTICRTRNEPTDG
jgi:hypothetical protein